VTVARATRVIASSILLAGVFAGGSSFAFPSAARATTHLTATTPAGRIVIARGDGSGRRVLGTGWTSFVSPDGARVAVTDFDQTSVGPTNHRLELFASAGGAPAHVLAIECLGVYWSPDSTTLACVDHEVPTGEPRRLLVIDAASAAVTSLATGYIDSRVSFSPDSARLAYAQNTSDASTRGGALKVVDLATHATTTLRRRAAAPVWGPRAIAFSTVKPGGPYGLTTNVAVVKPDGTGFRRLTRFRPKFLRSGLSPVAWSANGRRLLAALGGQDTRQAYAINPKRGGARRIRAFVTPSALSRDGRFVIGGDNTEAFDDPGRSNVVRVPWTGGKARVLLPRAGSPSFNG
jgi:Tol biopolymer transport system component